MKDTTRNILNILGINFDKEDFFNNLREEKRKERELNGIKK